MEWLEVHYLIFDHMELPNGCKVKLVVIYLQGWASAWWDQIKSTKEWCGKREVTLWQKMRLLRREAFQWIMCCPLFHCLQHIWQGDQLIQEYMEEFHQFVAHNDCNGHEELLVLRFLHGLWPAVLDQMILSPIFIVAEACRKVSLAEKGRAMSEVNLPRIGPPLQGAAAVHLHWTQSGCKMPWW